MQSSWYPENRTFFPLQSSLQWRHNEPDGVSNHQPHNWLLKRLFRRWSKKISKLRVIGLCVGNSTMTGEFPAKLASNAENVSIWWRHHVFETGLYLKKKGQLPNYMISFPSSVFLSSQIFGYVYKMKIKKDQNILISMPWSAFPAPKSVTTTRLIRKLRRFALRWTLVWVEFNKLGFMPLA